MDFSEVIEVINPYENPQKKYDVASNFYHLIMGVWEIKTNIMAIRMAEISDNDFVLDVACGTCWVMEKIMEITKHAIAIDYSDGMLSVCKKKIGSKNLVKANALNLPFKSSTFDIIFSSFLLDLLPLREIPIALKEMKRVVKGNGKIVAVSLSKEGEFFKKLFRILYEIFYYHWPLIAGYRASSRPIYLKNEIEKAGLKIIKRKITNIPLFHFPVEIIVAKP